MKKCRLLFVLAVLGAAVAYGQPPRDDREDGRPDGPPRPPLLELFDTDQDGEISAKEIENAAKVLKQLDRDGNGVLTPDELPRPPRPNDRRGDPGRERRGPGRDADPGRRREKRGSERDAEVARKVPAGTVIFQHGHETDPRDSGRPVALIAAALGVKDEVFRQAFSGVKPARDGAPTPERARENKQVLMEALGKYGITNDRLDEVSNYYRYKAEAGEVWKQSPAAAKAIIKDGKVTGFKIMDAGAGYTSPPEVTVAGYETVKVKATIEFSKDFRQNGRVTALSIVERDD